MCVFVVVVKMNSPYKKQMVCDEYYKLECAWICTFKFDYYLGWMVCELGCSKWYKCHLHYSTPFYNKVENTGVFIHSTVTDGPYIADGEGLIDHNSAK